MTISKFASKCSSCGRGFHPLRKHATLCAVCEQLGPGTTPERDPDYKVGQIHLQTDLLSGATQDPRELPRAPRPRRTLQDNVDRVVDAFKAQGIQSGRVTARESQRLEVQRFADRSGDRLTYRGFDVEIVDDERLR